MADAGTGVGCRAGMARLRPSRKRRRLGRSLALPGGHASAPRARGRGQPDEPAARRAAARQARPCRHHRRERPRSARSPGPRTVRPRAHGRADAGDGRADRDCRDPPPRSRHRPPRADHRHDRPRHEGRPRGLPGRRHGRLCPQADSGRRVVGRDRRHGGPGHACAHRSNRMVRSISTRRWTVSAAIANCSATWRRRFSANVRSG